MYKRGNFAQVHMSQRLWLSGLILISHRVHTKQRSDFRTEGGRPFNTAMATPFSSTSMPIDLRLDDTC